MNSTRGKKVAVACSLFIICSLIVNISHAQNGSQVKITKNAIGNTLGYLQYLPDDYSTNTNLYPTIIFLHGAGERGNGSSSALDLVDNQGTPKMIKQGATMCFTVNGIQECFIVLSPQQSTSRWGWQGDVIPFIDFALQKYKIDPNRIYVTGLSMGGDGSWDTSYGSDNDPNYIAAIAPVSGEGDYNQAKKTASKKIAVWAFHGDKDSAVPMSDGLRPIKGMNSVGANPVPIWTVIQGGGHSGSTWDKVYSTGHSYYSPNVYEWFLTKSKSGSTAPAPVVLNAPSNFSVSAVSSSTINLSWKDNSNNETGFEIQRSLSSQSGFSLVSTMPANTTTFSDAGLSSSTTYYYRVRTIDASQASSYSPVANATTSTEIIVSEGGLLWINKVGIVIESNTGNVIKTADYGTSSGASSQEVLAAGNDGWVETVINQTGKTRTIGLSQTDTDQDASSINYAISLSYNNTGVFIYESGASKGWVGKYTIGDVFRIERKGNIIYYKKNGATLRTSTKQSYSSLVVDISLLHTDAEIADTKISFGTASTSNARMATTETEIVEPAQVNETSVFSLYPNPARSTINISLPERNDDLVRIRIVDSSGRLEWEGTHSADSDIVLDLIALTITPGIKILSVMLSTGQVLQKRFQKLE